MLDGKILLLGDINVDSIWPIDAFPVPGRDALVDDIRNEVGGATLNSSVILDRLGMETALIGCMGDDLWADFIRHSMNSTNVNFSQVKTDPGAGTGLDMIFFMPDGERTMYGYRGSNKLLKPEMIDEQIFQHAAILHLSGYAFLEPPQRDAAWQAIAYAKKYHVPISVDTGLEPVLQNQREFLELLPYLEICITGMEEMALLLGTDQAADAAEKLLTKGVKKAVIKLGGKGSYFASEDMRFHCPAYPVEVKDTTGAGDSFSAGVLYGWKKELDLKATAVLASALGALATTVVGAGLVLPGKDKTTAFVKNVLDLDLELLQKGRKILMDHLDQ